MSSCTNDHQVIDALYIPTVQPALAPAWIDHILRYHNLPLPRSSAGKEFSYIDLGCGFGLTLILLAAAYPKAQFTGVDANAEHIEFARDLARRAELTNIEFFATTFAGLEGEQVAQADYVVADGVYTWVPKSVRLELIDAFDRLLKPGGAAMISANLVPGWLALMPVQRLLSDLRANQRDIDPEEMIASKQEFIEAVLKQSRSEIVKSGADLFSSVRDITPPGYVVHEYLPLGWQPIWTADLVQRLSSVGIEYAGDVELGRLRDEYAFTKAQRLLLKDAQTDALAHTMRDTFAPRYFARSIFHRPLGDRIKGAKKSRLYGWVALNSAHEQVEFTCYTPNGKLNFDSPTAHRIIKHLGNGGTIISELMEAVKPPSEEIFLKIVDCLCASGAVVPVDPPGEPDGVNRLNLILDERGNNTAYRATMYGLPMKPQTRSDIIDDP